MALPREPVRSRPTTWQKILPVRVRARGALLRCRLDQDPRVAAVRRWHCERPEFSAAVALLLPLVVMSALVSLRTSPDRSVEAARGAIVVAWDRWVPPWRVAEVERVERALAAERAIIAARPGFALPDRGPDIPVRVVEAPGVRIAETPATREAQAIGWIDFPKIVLRVEPPEIEKPAKVALVPKVDAEVPVGRKAVAVPEVSIELPVIALRTEAPEIEGPKGPEEKVARVASGAVCRPEDRTPPEEKAKAAAAQIITASAPDDETAFGRALAAAAIEQGSDLVVYDARYVRIAYPGGDVTSFYGVCSDVIVRAYRALGIDLQELVYRSRASGGDPNIDHRRTEMLRTFFARHGEQLPITQAPEDYLPGDIVTYWRPQNKSSTSHIAIVTDVIAPSARPMIVHNRGWGVELEDALFVDRITGHYRFRGMSAEQMAALPRPAPGGGGRVIAGTTGARIATGTVDGGSSGGSRISSGTGKDGISIVTVRGGQAGSRSGQSRPARVATTTPTRIGAPMGLGAGRRGEASGDSVGR